MTTVGGSGRVARAPVARGRSRRRLAPAGAWPVLVGACLALAGLSPALPWALAFDPQVWVMWGAQIWDGSLDTSSGPTWKPLPVLATVLLAPLGDGAVTGWLVLARAGGLLAVAGAFALGRRLGGRAAGVVAAVLVVVSPWWLVNTALGNSEGILVAAVLWAGMAHRRGRRGAALALVAAAALLRPEVWPFAAAYALAIWRSDAALRPAVGAAAAGGALLWLAPDLIGTGGALDAVGEARGPASPGAAQHAAIPAAAVLREALEQITVVGVLAAGAAILPWRRAGGVVRAMALAWLGYVALVAVSAQAGYAGTPRYLAPATALALVLAAIGAARIARRAGRSRPWLGAAALVVVCAGAAASHAGDLADGLWAIDQRAKQRTDLDVAVASAGGAAALRACGTVRTANATRGLVAWRLGVTLRNMADPPVRPGVLLRSRPEEGAALVPPAPPGFVPVARTRRWEILTACEGAGRGR